MSTYDLAKQIAILRGVAYEAMCELVIRRGCGQKVSFSAPSCRAHVCIVSIFKLGINVPEVEAGPTVIATPSGEGGKQ